MLFLSKYATKSPFDYPTWIFWIASTSIIWSLLFESIWHSFISNIFLFVVFLLGSIFLGVAQWLIIRNISSFSKGWILTYTISIPLGLIILTIYVLILASVGISSGLIGLSLFGLLWGISFGVIGVALSFALLFYLNNFLTIRISNKIAIEHVMMFDQIVLIKDATTGALIVSFIAKITNFDVGVMIGGIILALFTGFGIKDVGVLPLDEDNL